MKVLEFYSNNIYRLPNVDQGDKFDLVTYFFKTKLALQTRFYYMQRFLGGDDQETMLAEMESAWEDLSDESYELSDLELTNASIRSGKFEGKTYSELLTSSIEQHKVFFDQLIVDFQAYRQVRKDYDQIKVDTLTQISQFVENIGDVVVSETEQARVTKQNVYSTVIISIVLGVIIAICATLFCLATVVKPIVQAGQRMKQISTGDGDLTATLPVNGNDEIAFMGRYFNNFVGKIRDIISATISISENLSAAALHLESLSNKTSHATAEQQSGSSQIATALYEMTASFQEVAQNASSAEQATNDANASVKQSQTAVTNNKTSIERLSSDIVEASSAVSALADESEAVGSILNVIRGIAEQTNLLALNAAIEAARAGEQGRGFAVVADEVRTLAQKTQQSTTEIQTVIEGLQSRSHAAVDVMKNSQSLASESVDFANIVDQQLESVNKAVEDVFRMNAQIATASEEQASVAEDINRNVTHINDLSEQTSHDAQAALKASLDVKQMVDQMRDLVHQFKV
ncbi:methyl-accepting chemotaxis sensory transducer [Oleiphilus messinensis]|uniref:Methyl-accepting chemotaxis sensory transducer n=1 Tax=Oleiphilus messinensis TaxID=141451 RepID=A0A1Y0I5T4_9GAMM|nr:methyl-accepting chemotaxis protein [Oleiphilus messinensis]ARU55837.1 methyl-accepting chemotaxis sensory transducer [Oleiphilus messinensis]